MLIYALNSKHDQAIDLWQRLELASELKSDLQDTLQVGSSLLISMLEKVNWFLLTPLTTLVILMWK